MAVFYDSPTFRTGIHGRTSGPLSDKLVELSPIRVDLTVWGGS